MRGTCSPHVGQRPGQALVVLSVNMQGSGHRPASPRRSNHNQCEKVNFLCRDSAQCRGYSRGSGPNINVTHLSLLPSNNVQVCRWLQLRTTLFSQNNNNDNYCGDEVLALLLVIFLPSNLVTTAVYYVKQLYFVFSKNISTLNSP